MWAALCSLNCIIYTKKSFFSFDFHFSCVICLYFCISPLKPLRLTCKFELSCVCGFLGFVGNMKTSPFHPSFL